MYNHALFNTSLLTDIRLQPTRLNSSAWRLGLAAFFPLLTLKPFSALALQIPHRLRSDISRLAHMLSFDLDCSILVDTATPHHAVFWSVNLFFRSFGQKPLGGEGDAFIITFYVYFTLFHFYYVGFSYSLCFSLLFHFKTCMQADALTVGRKMHAQ